MHADDLTIADQVLACAQAVQTAVRFGRSLGYDAAPAKSWTVCSEADEPKVREIINAQGVAMRYTHGQRYVEGFIGLQAMEDEWIAPQVEKWAAGVDGLARIAKRFPQSAYVGLV